MSCDGLSSPSSRSFRWVHNSRYDSARTCEWERERTDGWWGSLRAGRRSRARRIFLREATRPTSKYLHGRYRREYIFCPSSARPRRCVISLFLSRFFDFFLSRNPRRAEAKLLIKYVEVPTHYPRLYKLCSNNTAPTSAPDAACFQKRLSRCSRRE